MGIALLWMIPKHLFLTRVLQLLAFFVPSPVGLGIKIGVEPTKEVGGGRLAYAVKAKKEAGVVGIPIRRRI